ncbi:MAG: WG repeat-containing protein, partial [Bacteroidaceae bacterium]|nr:WG repeat-containing protein [Bacteroidaceae bacterium]
MFKHIFFGALMLMVSACGNQGKGSEQTNQDTDSEQTLQGKDSMVIIAVNTDNGVGFFTDNKGTFLFNKQFEGVSKFSEGLARVKQNGKYGYINTKGEVVVPCIYDTALNFS